MKDFIDSKIGLIRVFNDDNISLIENKKVSLGGLELIPGQKTTLHNFFNDEVIYLGLYYGFLQFKIGEDISLFGKDTWCNEFKKIDENCIVNIYQPGTARNYIFKNGVWK